MHTSAALLASLSILSSASAQHCNAPIELVFALDESGSVGRSNYNKAKDFMKDVVTRFNIGPGVNEARVAVVTFSTLAEINWKLDAHTDVSSLNTAIDNIAYDAGWTCTGKVMETITDNIICPGCPGNRASSSRVVLFLTDGNPSASRNCQPEVNRITAIENLKLAVDRVVPVGIGSGISEQYLQSLAHNMPIVNGKNYIMGTYSALGDILDDLARAACPTSAPTMPTLAPTVTPSAAPSIAPTFEPTVGPTYSCVNPICNPTCSANGFCYAEPSADPTPVPCAVKKCGCNAGFMGTGQVCTVAPTAAPTTVSPTAAPTTSQPTTSYPTTAPSAPTKAPTYWVLFGSGDESQEKAAAQSAATAAGVGLGALAIVAIILAVVAAVVLLAMIAGGVGIFAVRQKLFETAVTVDGKQLQKGTAAPVAVTLTPEQVAAMGLDTAGGGDVLPSHAEVFASDASQA